MQGDKAYDMLKKFSISREAWNIAVAEHKAYVEEKIAELHKKPEEKKPK